MPHLYMRANLYFYIKSECFFNNVNAVNENDQTALHLAATHSNKGSIETLIANGANPNTMDKYY